MYDQFGMITSGIAAYGPDTAEFAKEELEEWVS